MIDRFGKITEPVENLLLVAQIRLAAKNLSVKSVTEKNLRVEIIFGDIKKVSSSGLIQLGKIFRKDLKFVESAKRLFLTFKTKKNLLTGIFKVLKVLTRRD